MQALRVRGRILDLERFKLVFVRSRSDLESIAERLDLPIIVDEERGWEVVPDAVHGIAFVYEIRT